MAILDTAAVAVVEDDVDDDDDDDDDDELASPLSAEVDNDDFFSCLLVTVFLVGARRSSLSEAKDIPIEASGLVRNS